jgi:hypothetical protein
VFGAETSLSTVAVLGAIQTAMGEFAGLFSSDTGKHNLVLTLIQSMRAALNTLGQTLPETLDFAQTANLIQHFKDLITDAKLKGISDHVSKFAKFAVKDLRDYIPHAALGGMVDKATLGIFGEGGPEALVPLNSNGISKFMTIIARSISGSQNNLMSMARAIDGGNGGGTTLHINIHSGAFQANVNNSADAEQLPKKMMEELLFQVKHGRLGKAIEKRVS